MSESMLTDPTIKVPTPGDFQIILVQKMAEALVHLKDIAPQLSETLQSQIEKAASVVLERLAKGGQEYGEDVLFLVGEHGILTMVTSKVLRALWSFAQDDPRIKRDDHYLDLAGYAIIAMALEEYMRNGRPETETPHEWAMEER